MQIGSLRFEGIGPFYLRSVESARASVLAETVQVTLYAALDDQEKKIVQIETQMTPKAAQELAGYLLDAALKACGNQSPSDGQSLDSV